MRTRSAFFAPSRLRPTTSCCDARRSGLPSEAASAWGRMERETGIEPATNSLEGCDSTTELLPPSCSPLTLARTSARQSPPSYSRVARTRPAFQARSPRSDLPSSQLLPSPTGLPSRSPRRGQSKRRSPGRRLVARGGFEPPKPLGRQIYSLLRLTAPQPRQLSSSAVAQTRASVHEYPDARFFCVEDGCFSALTCRIPNRSGWSWRRDLNPRPADYKSAALPG